VTSADRAGPLRRVARAVRRLVRPDPVIIRVEKPRPPFNLRHGSVQPHEAELLRRLVERANGFDGPMIEIGALFGMTTVKIARWKAPGKPLITVDNFGWNPLGLTPAEHQELTTAVLGCLIDTGQVEIRVQAKNEFYEAYSGPPPALVFLDAIHTYEETKRDLDWALTCGARVICGHDYVDEFAGVRQAVDEAGGPHELAGSLWALAPRG
jgi:hypothetical protein